MAYFDDVVMDRMKILMVDLALDTLLLLPYRAPHPLILTMMHPIHRWMMVPLS
jgi:hypothetical protein